LNFWENTDNTWPPNFLLILNLFLDIYNIVFSPALLPVTNIMYLFRCITFIQILDLSDLTFYLKSKKIWFLLNNNVKSLPICNKIVTLLFYLHLLLPWRTFFLTSVFTVDNFKQSNVYSMFTLGTKEKWHYPGTKSVTDRRMNMRIPIYPWLSSSGGIKTLMEKMWGNKI
jgi:hypothetical protein